MLLSTPRALPIETYLRLRPSPNVSSALVIQPNIEPPTLTIHPLATDNSTTKSTVVNNHINTYQYSFNHIFVNAAQESLWNLCGKSIVDNTIEGYNSTLLSYGQTGSGKTYTLNGSSKNYDNRGLIPRAIEYLFYTINNDQDNEYVIRCSYVEIYGETLVDLLTNHNSNNTTPTNSNKTKSKLSEDLQIQEDEKGTISIKNLTLPVLNSAKHALSLYFTALPCRSTAPHPINTNSSRSHAIYSLYLEKKNKIQSNGLIITSKMNWVDLAGSERINKTNNLFNNNSNSTSNKSNKSTIDANLLLNESRLINKSLSALEQCIVAIGKRNSNTNNNNNNTEHIPYRTCKLTHLLRDSLNGNCITKLIACIQPEFEHLEETISTCKFTGRLRRLNVMGRIEKIKDNAILLENSRKENELLRMEIKMYEELNSNNNTNKSDIIGNLITNTTYTPLELQEVRENILNSINSNNTTTLDTLVSNSSINSSNNKLKDIIQILKNIILSNKIVSNVTSTRNNNNNNNKNNNINDSNNEKNNTSNTNSSKTDNAYINNLPSNISYVGELVENKGFNLGSIPINNKPKYRPDSTESSNSNNIVTASTSNIPELDFNSTNSPFLPTLTPKPYSKPSEEEILIEYQQTTGKALYLDYSDTKKELINKKKEIEEVYRTLMEKKETVSQVREEVMENRNKGFTESKEDSNTSTSTDTELESRYNTLKSGYKLTIEDYNNLLEELAEIEDSLSIIKNTFCKDFLIYYESKYKNDGDENSIDFHYGGNNNSGSNSDMLDDGEKFDQLEANRIMSKNPNALDFFQAKKTATLKEKSNKAKHKKSINNMTRIK